MELRQQHRTVERHSRCKPAQCDQFVAFNVDLEQVQIGEVRQDFIQRASSCESRRLSVRCSKQFDLAIGRPVVGRDREQATRVGRREGHGLYPVESIAPDRRVDELQVLVERFHRDDRSARAHEMRRKRGEIADVRAHVDKRVAGSQALAHDPGDMRFIGMAREDQASNIAITRTHEQAVAIHRHFDRRVAPTQRVFPRSADRAGQALEIKPPSGDLGRERRMSALVRFASEQQAIREADVLNCRGNSRLVCHRAVRTTRSRWQVPAMPIRRLASFHSCMTCSTAAHPTCVPSNRATSTTEACSNSISR